MAKPLVSIIIPTYNRSSMIGETLDSVSAQTYQNWECIIVDDGSIDDTKIIAENWCNNDKRFRYYYKENGGISSARNYGIARVKGSFVQFLDSDDMLSNRKLELSIKEMNEENCVNTMVISNFKMLANDVNSYSNPYCRLHTKILNFNSILYNWDIEFSIPIHCGLFHESLFKEFKFPEEIKAYEDWLMWIYFFQKKGKVFFIDKPLAVYRVHPGNICNNLKHLGENYLKAILYIPQILSQEQTIEFYQFLLKKDHKKIAELQTSVNNFYQSKTYLLYLQWRNNSMAKFLSRLFKA